MDAIEDLDNLLEIENEQEEENIQLEQHTNQTITEQQMIEEINGVDQDLIDILNETVEVNQTEDQVDTMLTQTDNKNKQYIYLVPPEGSSTMCKLGNGDLVFLKRSKQWHQNNYNKTNMQLLTQPIESIIEKAREIKAKKEIELRDIQENGVLRSQQINWEKELIPRTFMQLLSDSLTNRVFMKWLSQWKPMLFNTKENESTTDIDNLPFYCPICHKGGFHSPKCTSTQQLRPYFKPDLPSPLPTRPINPLFVLSGPIASGKTTLVKVASRIHNLRIVQFAGEMSGISIQQTLQDIKSVLESNTISFQKALPPLLLFDNFDTAFSISERKAIIHLLVEKFKECQTNSRKLLFPVYLCNLYECKSYCQHIHMPQITSKQQQSFLYTLCKNHSIPYETSAINHIVQLSDGDIRYAINTVQAVILIAGEVTEESLEKANIGTKERVHDIQDYWKLVFIYSRSHGRSGNIISNISSLFQFFYDVDSDKVIQGIFEVLSSIPIPDPTLHKYCESIDAIIQYELLFKKSRQLNDFSLQNTLPALIGMIHLLYRRERSAKIPRITTKSELTLYRNRINNKNAILPLKYSRALYDTEGCRTLPLITEYLSPLVLLITPSIRPVDTLLMTNKEKREVARIALNMAEYGLSYESIHKEGSLEIELKPDLVSMTTYSDRASPLSKVMNAVKFKMQAELQKVRIQNDISPIAIQINENDLVKKISETKNIVSTPKKQRKRSSKETPKKPLQMNVEVNEKEIEKKMTPIKRNAFFSIQKSSKTRKTIKGIVFRFQQGFTSAVRQPALLSDFL